MSRLASHRDRRFPWRALGLALLGVLAIALVVLATFDWNRLKGPLERYASGRTGYAVDVAGDLDVRLFSRRPRVAVGGLSVSNPRWRERGRLLAVDSIDLEWRWLPLLTGRLVVERLTIRRPRVDLYMDGQGRANWHTVRVVPRAESSDGQPPDLPLVRRFVIEDGALRVDDLKHRLRIAGTLAAAETAGRGGEAFRVAANGTLNREPFRLDVAGGPLVNLDPGEPYAFDTRVVAGDTRIAARTRIDEPFDLARLSSEATLEGRDLAELYFLTGAALPNSRPYRLVATLRREGSRIDVTRLQGRVGGSDLGGTARVELAGERPKLSARLVSKELDLGDLAAPLGVGLGGAGDAAAGEGTGADGDGRAARRAAARRGGPDGRLLPDAELQVPRLQAFDADVRFRAESVRARRVPFRDVDLGVRLQAGVLTLEPLQFRFQPGQLSGRVRIDSRGEVPSTALDLRVTGLDLGRVQFRRAQAAGGGEDAGKGGRAARVEPPLEGILRGRLQLRGPGGSVREFAANADGGATFVIPDGAVNQAFAQLTGIQVARGLGLLLSDADKQTGLRCGVVDFRIRDGLAEARTLVFDTDVVRIGGRGKVSFDDESLDLEIRGEPKKASLLRLRTPIEVGGTFADPALGVDAGRLAAQGGVAAVLGAVLAPLAAVLAFVDPGLADDANCGALVAEARSRGAPVPKRVAEAEAAAERPPGRAADRDRDEDGKPRT